MNDGATQSKAARRHRPTQAKRPTGGALSTTPTATSHRILDAHLRAHIDPDKRRSMVAEAAYFFAEHRGFEPGYEINDWLAAEDQIDAALRLADMATAALLREQER
jgi:hypothetical protein